MSPALAGGFLTTGPPGKSLTHLFVNPRSDMKVFQDGVEGLKASLDGDFPGGPEARTLRSQCRGSKFFSWGQGIRSHMPQLKIPNATT